MTCNGIPRGPVLPSTQMTWCGMACSTEGLRYTNQGAAGMNGWMVDESYTGEKVYSSSVAVTSFYATCDPPTDGYVQSYDPEDGTADTYSLYSFGYGEEYLLESGKLSSSEISFQSSDTYNLSTLSEHYKLAGPKTLLDSGVTGPADYVINLNSSTIGEWATEPGLLWDTDVTYVFKGVEDAEFPSFTLSDRTSEHTLVTFTTLDYKVADFPFVQIDNSHLAMARLVENGANYDVYIDVLEYNFSTELLSTVNSYLVWSDEPRPATYVFSSNRLVFIPTWGANGILYVSHPLRTNTKTEEGFVLPLTWDGVNAFTVGSPVYSGVRNGHMGSCIGWDGSTDRLVYGIEEDDIATMNSDGSSGPTFGGPRNSLMGQTFATGDGYTIAWDADVADPKLLRLTTIWTHVSTIGWAYNNNEVLYAGVCTPLGDSGTRVPQLVCRNATGSTIMTAWKGPTEVINYSSGFVPRYAWGKSTVFQTTNVGWQSGDVAYGNASPNWGLDVTNYVDDYISPVPRYSRSVNFCMYNGSDEAVIHLMVSSDGLRKFYNITKLEVLLDDHVQIGSHYVLVTHDLSNFTDIVSANLGFESYSESLEKRAVDFFLQFDDDPLYYVTSVSGLVSYSSIDDAKLYAESVVLYGSRIPSIDVTTKNSFYTYIVLKKEYTASYPLLSPKASFCTLEVTGPGLTEPVLLTHFADGSFTRPKRTSAGVLSVGASPSMLTTGTKLMVSGTETRELFSS